MHEIYLNLVEFLNFHEKAGPGAPMAQTLYKPNEIQCLWESFYPQTALWGKNPTLGGKVHFLWKWWFWRKKVLFCENVDIGWKS